MEPFTGSTLEVAYRKSRVEDTLRKTLGERKFLQLEEVLSPIQYPLSSPFP